MISFKEWNGALGPSSERYLLRLSLNSYNKTSSSESSYSFDSARLTGSMMTEFKDNLNKYLSELGPKAPFHSLKEIIDFNEKNHEREMPYFGQELFLKAEAKGPLTTADYLKAL